MNPVIENIKNRRSIRKYLPDEIPKKIVEELLDIASYAPSSHNRQPWNFTILNSTGKIDEVSDDIRRWYDSMIKLSSPLFFINEVKKSVDEMRKRVKSEKDLFFYHAPLVIIIHAPSKKFFQQDCAAAAQNIMLAARSMDIGSCWIGFADIVLNKSRKLKNKLNIPSSHRVMATIALGYTEKFPSNALPRRKFKTDWI